MHIYLISYDLTEPASIRNLLAGEIMDLGRSWARPLANCWYLRSDLPQSQIEERLRDHLDIDDGLLIQPVRDDAVMMNTSLRWFRQRRRDDSSAVETNVVAFPAAAAQEADEATPPFAEAC